MKIAHLLFDGDHLYRLEEAETNLVAKQEANALLNSQVDILTKQLKELQAGKAAYEKHVRDLTALLTKERRKHVTEPEQVAWKRLHSVLQPKIATLQWTSTKRAVQATASTVSEAQTEDPSTLDVSTAGAVLMVFHLNAALTACSAVPSQHMTR